MYCAGKVICMTGGHGWQEGIEADGKDACLKSSSYTTKKWCRPH